MEDNNAWEIPYWGNVRLDQRDDFYLAGSIAEHYIIPGNGNINIFGYIHYHLKQILSGIIFLKDIKDSSFRPSLVSAGDTWLGWDMWHSYLSLQLTWRRGVSRSWEPEGGGRREASCKGRMRRLRSFVLVCQLGAIMMGRRYTGDQGVLRSSQSNWTQTILQYFWTTVNSKSLSAHFLLTYQESLTHGLHFVVWQVTCHVLQISGWSGLVWGARRAPPPSAPSPSSPGPPGWSSLCSSPEPGLLHCSHWGSWRWRRSSDVSAAVRQRPPLSRGTSRRSWPHYR